MRLAWDSLLSFAFKVQSFIFLARNREKIKYALQQAQISIMIISIQNIAILIRGGFYCKVVC